MKNEKLTTNNFYKQKIRLKDDSPVYRRNYRIPQSQQTTIDSEVQKLIENDVIEPARSPYNSPILLVPKKSKDGERKWRLVVDYRELNKKVIPDKFPLSRIDELLDLLGRSRYFSVIDLQSGFHQIELEENFREMTAFSTNKGQWQFKRVPFGLNISPDGFSRMMSLAFGGMKPETALLYMDDIVVLGCSENHHLRNLEQVFEVCRKYQLKLNPDKCEFFRHEVVFLGHRCTGEGVLPDQTKFEAIRNYLVPG